MKAGAVFRIVLLGGLVLPEAADAKVYCALMLGQFGQPADYLLAFGGMNRLAARSKALGVPCEVFSWDAEVYGGKAVSKRIKAQPAGTKNVVCGDSLGANEAPRVAYNLGGRKIDFLCGIQPSKFGAPKPVPATVVRAMVFPQQPALALLPWPFGWGLGSYEWVRAPGNRSTVMLKAYSNATHPGTSDPPTQTFILNEIKRLR